MIEPQTTALILLAAGRSRRFGAADKLAQPLGGRPLGLHVAHTLRAMPFAARIAVVSQVPPDFAAYGFALAANPAPDEGMSRSIAIGLDAARGHPVEAVLIVLADMPCVTEAHVARLFAAADGPDTIVASSDGERPSPPALFGASWFDALAALHGDAGARTLIRRARHVIAPPGELVDIDSEEALRRLDATDAGPAAA